jgi:hypothetical protein
VSKRERMRIAEKARAELLAELRDHRVYSRVCNSAYWRGVGNEVRKAESAIERKVTRSLMRQVIFLVERAEVTP